MKWVHSLISTYCKQFDKMSQDYNAFKCPYPFIIPESFANETNLSTNQCTYAVANILEPEIIACQIVFVLCWLIVLMIHLNTINRIRKINFLPTVERYRYNMAKVGALQAILDILYWVLHDNNKENIARGYWDYNNNNYLDELISIVLFWLSLNLVDFWGAIAKIRVKLRVDIRGIPLIEKYTFLGLYAAGAIVIGGLEYYGPQDICSLFSAVRFMIYAIIVFALGMRAFMFVLSIEKGIKEIEGSHSDNLKRRLIYQLRIKFAVFIALCMGSAMYSFVRSITKFTFKSYACSIYLIDWSFRYELPFHQFIYIFAAYGFLFQFTDISKLFCGAGISSNKVLDKKASDRNVDNSTNHHFSTRQNIHSIVVTNNPVYAIGAIQNQVVAQQSL